MNASIQLYAFEDNLVRVHSDDNGDPWFVAKDVCGVLGIASHRDATGRLDDDERGSVLVDTLGGQQKMSAISESGVYALIFTSRKPEAKAFRKWVTSEVLPSIRKTGKYEHRTVDRDEIRERASRVKLRASVKSRLMTLAVQVSKMEGGDSEDDVLEKYVSLAEVLAGPAGTSVSRSDPVDDLIDGFVSERVEDALGFQVSATDLYKAFYVWCSDNGEQCVPTMALFGRRMGERFRKVRQGTVRYIDIRLVEE